MQRLDRRAFLGAAATVFTAAACNPTGALAAVACVTSGLPAFLPNRLTVDCASRRNFALFRKNPSYLGLAGAVSMTAVRGRRGVYEAGNLFLFPWLKPKGIALGGNVAWSAVMPTDARTAVAAAPIPGSQLPQDEYFCNVVLQAKAALFIGLGVDVPFDTFEAKLGLYTNVPKLADGKPVGVDWASSNLNHPWFGGSRAIPATEACNGAAWRSLIVDGLNQASVGAC